MIEPGGWLIPTGDPGVHGFMLSRAEMAQRSSARADSYMAEWEERGGESGEPEKLEHSFYVKLNAIYYFTSLSAG